MHGWCTNHRFYRSKDQHYVGNGPEGLAVSARCLYVASRGSNTVAAIRLDEPPAVA